MGPVSFNWLLKKDLAKLLACHVCDTLYCLRDTKKISDELFNILARQFSTDWFLTEIVEQYITFRGISLRKE